MLDKKLTTLIWILTIALQFFQITTPKTNNMTTIASFDDASLYNKKLDLNDSTPNTFSLRRSVSVRLTKSTSPKSSLKTMAANITISEEDIANFCRVTNASPTVARTYLTVSDGNVEQAITLFLESGGVDLSSLVGSQQQSSDRDLSDIDAESELERDAAFARRLAEENNRVDDAALARQLAEEPVDENYVRAPIPPVREVLVGESDADDSITDALFRSGYYSSSDQGQSAFDILFRPPYDIMHKEDFEKTRARARNENKWLMVNIQADNDFSCMGLNRDLWSNNTVKDVIRAHFYFLQFNINHPEGRRYNSFYPIENYPHIAIIDPRTGERLKVWNKQMESAEFIISVTDFLERHSLSDLSSKIKIENVREVKGISDMTEEEQMNAAMLESMNNRPSISNNGEETPIVAETESTHESPGTNTVFDTIKPVQREEPPVGEANVTRIQFRLPDSSKKVRRFRKSDPLLYLFQYIKSEFVPDQPFELVFNRQQLIEKIDQTIQEAGLENASVSVGL
ncbi:12154_t:CDS:10 [Ambispora leptoticha]|uniref:12154_t:CDS:1 n=1 Tax=Ambispora leptoticha TaxID=144679 RepID=A0A9N9CAA7_9GLOM|nr:12154_t:CDS:10 [Ambispora leptoticha]